MNAPGGTEPQCSDNVFKGGGGLDLGLIEWLRERKGTDSRGAHATSQGARILRGRRAAWESATYLR